MFLHHLEEIGLANQFAAAANGGVLQSFSAEAKFTIIENVQRELSDMLLQGTGQKDYRAVCSPVHLNWHLEVLGSSFSLPLTDAKHVKLIQSVMQIYIQWLGLSGEQPPVVEAMGQEVACRIMTHFSQIFEVRDGVNAEFQQKQRWLCRWTIDVAELLANNGGIDFSCRDWVKILWVFVGTCDYAFLERHRRPAHSGTNRSNIFDTELQSSLVRVCLILWLRSNNQSPDVCNLMQQYLVKWRDQLPAVQMSCSILQACSQCLVSDVLEPRSGEGQSLKDSPLDELDPHTENTSPGHPEGDSSATVPLDTDLEQPKDRASHPLSLTVSWPGKFDDSKMVLTAEHVMFFWRQILLAVTHDFEDIQDNKSVSSGAATANNRYSLRRLSQLCRKNVQVQEALVAGLRQCIDAFKSVEFSFVVTRHPLHSLLRQPPMFRRNSIYDVIGLSADPSVAVSLQRRLGSLASGSVSNRDRAVSTSRNVRAGSDQNRAYTLSGTPIAHRQRGFRCGVEVNGDVTCPFPAVDNAIMIRFFGETLVAAALDEREQCFTSRSVAFHLLSKLIIESHQTFALQSPQGKGSDPTNDGSCSSDHQHAAFRAPSPRESQKVQRLYFASALSYITRYCKHIEIAQAQREARGGALYIPSSVESDIACFFVSGWRLFGCDDFGIITGCKFLIPHIGPVVKYMLTEMMSPIGIPAARSVSNATTTRTSQSTSGFTGDLSSGSASGRSPSSSTSSTSAGAATASNVALPRARPQAEPDTPHFLGSGVLKHVRRACVRVAASILSLPNYYDRGQWKQRGLFFTEQTSHTISRFGGVANPEEASSLSRNGEHNKVDNATAQCPARKQQQPQSDSSDDYRSIRSWLGKSLTDALGTVRDATTLQLLLHVLAQKVLEDSQISPGIAQIAISLISAHITMKSSPRHRWSIEVKISAFNALQTMSCLQSVIHKAATATIPSLIKKIASFVIKLTTHVLQTRNKQGSGAGDSDDSPSSSSFGSASTRRASHEELPVVGSLHLILAALQCIHQWLVEAPWVMQIADIADLLGTAVLTAGMLLPKRDMRGRGWRPMPVRGGQDWGVLPNQGEDDVNTREICERVHKEAVLMYVHIMHNIGHTPFIERTAKDSSGSVKHEDVFYATNHTEASLLELLKKRYHRRVNETQTVGDFSDDPSATTESYLVRHFMLNRRAIVSVVMYGGEVQSQNKNEHQVFTIPAAAELAVLIRHASSGKVVWIAAPKLLATPFPFREMPSVPSSGSPSPAHSVDTTDAVPDLGSEHDLPLAASVVSVVEHEHDYSRCGWVNRQYLTSSAESMPYFSMYVELFQSCTEARALETQRRHQAALNSSREREQHDRVREEPEETVEPRLQTSAADEHTDPGESAERTDDEKEGERQTDGPILADREAYVRRLAAQACWVAGRALLSHIGVGTPSDQGLEPVLFMDEGSSELPHPSPLSSAKTRQRSVPSSPSEPSRATRSVDASMSSQSSDPSVVKKVRRKSYAEVAATGILPTPVSTPLPTFYELLRELDSTPTRLVYAIDVVPLIHQQFLPEQSSASTHQPKADTTFSASNQICLGTGGQRFCAFLRSLGWVRPSALADGLNAEVDICNLPLQLIDALKNAEKCDSSTTDSHVGGEALEYVPSHLYYSDARKEIFFGVVTAPESQQQPNRDSNSERHRQDGSSLAPRAPLFPVKAPNIVQIIWNDCHFDLQLKHFDWAIYKQHQNIPDALVRIVVRPMVCRPGLYSVHIVQALSRHDESELLTSIFREDVSGYSFDRRPSSFAGRSPRQWGDGVMGHSVDQDGSEEPDFVPGPLINGSLVCERLVGQLVRETAINYARYAYPLLKHSARPEHPTTSRQKYISEIQERFAPPCHQQSMLFESLLQPQ